jgi:hypothetical protein
VMSLCQVQRFTYFFYFLIPFYIELKRKYRSPIFAQNVFAFRWKAYEKLRKFRKFSRKRKLIRKFLRNPKLMRKFSQNQPLIPKFSRKRTLMREFSQRLIFSRKLSRKQ